MDEAILTLDAIADRLADRIAERLTTKRKPLYTEPEAAQRLGVSVFTLRSWRLTGKVKATKQRHRVFYTAQQVEDVRLWVEGGGNRVQLGALQVAGHEEGRA